MSNVLKKYNDDHDENGSNEKTIMNEFKTNNVVNKFTSLSHYSNYSNWVEIFYKEIDDVHVYPCVCCHRIIFEKKM